MIRCWSQGRARAGLLQDNKRIFHSNVNAYVYKLHLRSAQHSYIYVGLEYVVPELLAETTLNFKNHKMSRLNFLLFICVQCSTQFVWSIEILVQSVFKC